MRDAFLNRFEWLKAVLQAEELTPTAKNVASAIAVQFANDETGQINPSQETLADFLKVHRDTVKRVLRELRNAGWLMATGDGGRGKAPFMRLLSPGKIIPFGVRKRGDKSSPDPEKRGGDLWGKGGRNTPPLLKDKQSKNKEGARETDAPDPIPIRYRDHRFIGSITSGPRIVPSTDFGSLNRWADWLADEGFPRLCDTPLGRKAEKGKTIFFALPSKCPPTCAAGRAEARGFFEAVLDGEASRHAAQ